MTIVKPLYAGSLWTVMDADGLANLSSSATAGWQSAAVSNASDRFAGIELVAALHIGAGTPANSKGAFFYGHVALGVLNGKYPLTHPASGVKGAITHDDMTSLAQVPGLIGQVPLVTESRQVIGRSMGLSLISDSNSILPAWSVSALNHCGIATVAAKTVTITRSGSTATANATGHGFSASIPHWVYVYGADQPEYNGIFPIESVPDADNFTYTVSGTPATPATGTIKAQLSWLMYRGLNAENV